MSEQKENPEAKTEAKKPPVHEILIALLNGGYSELLARYSFADSEYWIAIVTGIIIAKSHFPEDARPKLVEALLKRVKEDGDQIDDYEPMAEALKALGGNEALLIALKEEASRGEEGITTFAYDYLHDLAEVMGLEIPDDLPEPE